MMKGCEWSECPKWAQYVATYPDKTKRIFCVNHAERFKELNPDTQVKVRFVGVMPDGLKNS